MKFQVLLVYFRLQVRDAKSQKEHRIDHYISHEKHIYKYKLTHISPSKDTAMVSNGTKLVNIYMYIYRSDYGMSHELILHVVQETLSIPH